MQDYCNRNPASPLSRLTSITILGDVTSIGYNAFSDCTSLTSITIPKSVKSIENNAFSGCTALTEVLLEGGSTLTYTDLGVDANKVVTRWNEGDLTWTLTADGTMTISGSGAMKAYDTDDSPGQIVFVPVGCDFACNFTETFACQRRTAFKKYLGQSSTAVKHITSDACNTL